jgi:hypothetical protein
MDFTWICQVASDKKSNFLSESEVWGSKKPSEDAGLRKAFIVTVKTAAFIC